MQRIVIAILFLGLFSFTSFAQADVTGVVLDKETGDFLAGANVILLPREKGVSTSADGKFEFHELIPGEYVIEVSFVGYQPYREKFQIQNSDKDLTIHLSPTSIDINKVTIVSTRKKSDVEDIPAQVEVIDKEQVEYFPVSNIDDLLKSIANVNVNRSWGIFSKNSSVTMRGLDAAQSILVLYNGVPLNKTAGGSINWHMISPDRIERIEVIKGPASALYGNNAMGGVINIITKKSNKPLSVDARVSTSTFNTYAGNVSLDGKKEMNQNQFYYGINGFYRQGDGYIVEPLDTRDSTDVPVYLKEGRIGANAGYKINDNHLFDIEYNYYDDKRGDGVQTFEEDGGYVKYTTNFIRAKYNGAIGKFSVNANLFYQHENYYTFSEKLNSTGDEYKMLYREQISRDYGLWISANTELFRNNTLTFGADFKNGYMDAVDQYMTSTDKLERAGAVSFYAIFLQDEWAFMNKKLWLVTGLRADYASFYDGYLNVEEPTANTGFPDPTYEEYGESEWLALSPKISLQYKFEKFGRTYVSYSRGFMPAKLDDMVSSRKISKGFKIANPELDPQTLDNYEWGGSFNLMKGLVFETSVYYSLGHDFQYFVETGNYVDGNTELIRENISEVEIMGTEVTLKYSPVKQLSLKANYTYNQSVIKEFDLEGYSGDDLIGKELIEIPKHQAFAAIFWENKYFNTSLVYTYTGEEWANDNNTAIIDDYSLLDFRISKMFKNHYQLSFDVQNIFDVQYVDKKQRMAPGRFMTLELAVKF